MDHGHTVVMNNQWHKQWDNEMWSVPSRKRLVMVYMEAAMMNRSTLVCWHVQPLLKLLHHVRFYITLIITSH